MVKPIDSRVSVHAMADYVKENHDSDESPSAADDIHGHLHKLTKVLAPLHVDILLEGETGTGKDMLARRIYELSGCKGPLVPVNCGAIPENLTESELFGVEPGAYTGASHARAGYIETANNGILFLDEIDSMPLTVQAKLLRVLETRTITRLGSTKQISLNLRVIAASQTPLEQLVESGSFRRDLSFRLNTIKLETPTLRSRPELIIPLFRRFVLEAALRLGMPHPPSSTVLDEALLLHCWPGNLRELKSVAERFILGLPPLNQKLPQESGTVLLKERLKRIERSLINDCLNRHDHRIDDVVYELGIPRRTLYLRLKQLNIHP